MQTPRYWQSRFPALFLLPIAALFGLLAAMRRQLYQWGCFKSTKLGKPIVVVGNLTAGGAGKTPTVRYLAEALQAKGYAVGIISRGYGGSSRQVEQVDPNGSASRYGDEPLLLARTSGCPLFIGQDRVASSQALLAAYPNTQLILSDDGLQHYRLRRDVEIVVMDGARGLQNGWLLPAGPLRETAARLQQADCLLINGEPTAPLPSHPTTFQMHLQPGLAWRLSDPAQRRPLSHFAHLGGPPLAALAGIANPERFFNTLRAAGISGFTAYPFADHHAFCAADLAAISAHTLLVTEKDAVKLAALPHGGNIWVVPVAAKVSPDLADWLIQRLGEACKSDV